jgi:hypothetical protein
MARTLPALLLALGASIPGVAGAQAAPPSTDIFLVPLTVKGRSVTVGRPENITSRPGYDNQPAFTADGRSVLFTSVRDDAQADIYRYDIAKRVVKPVTQTPESEYSATVMPGDTTISVIRVEADSTQRLWQFSLDGTHPRLVLERIKPVGYHAWADDHSLALFVLGRPATLQSANTRTGDAKIMAERIGRALQKVPNRRAVSFIQNAGTDSAWIKILDFATGTVTPLARPVAGSEFHVWLPDGSLLMASGAKLYRREAAASGGPADWTEIATFDDPHLARISRLAISWKGDRLALVGEPAPAPGAR